MVRYGGVIKNRNCYKSLKKHHSKLKIGQLPQITVYYCTKYFFSSKKNIFHSLMTHNVAKNIEKLKKSKNLSTLPKMTKNS